MLWTFLRAVDRERIEPVCVFLHSGPFVDEVAALGIRTSVIPTRRLRKAHLTLSDVLRLSRILRREQPDLIVNWLEMAQLYGGPAAAIARLRDRNAWWAHEIPDRWQFRAAARLPTRAVGTSSYVVAEQVSRLRPRRPRFTVLPGIAEPALISPPALEALRSSARLPRDASVLGILGRLVPMKGQREFVRMIALLRDDGHDVHGLIVGGEAAWSNPGYASELAELAQELGVASAITFTGQVSDASAYLQLMDVCVNACAREAFGLAMLEAMAVEVPVVALDAPGARELIEDGESGLLVTDATPRGLADAVARLLVDASLRERVARGGKECHRARFGAERMVEDLERSLERISSGSDAGERGEARRG
jgi:glycosyltransferase involved in cell wall biosynthesis